MNSPIEKDFERLMIKNNLDGGMVKEFKYYRFRYDFAWPFLKVAIECQSRKWHKTPTQLERDRYKLNVGQINGWIVLHVSTFLLRKKPNIVIGIVSKALSLRKKHR